MRHTHRYSRSPVRLAIFLLGLLLVVAACGGGSGNQPAPATASSQQSGSTGSQQPSSSNNVPAATSAPAQGGSSAPSSDLESRVSDSMNRLLGIDKQYLASYHLEITGTAPEWDKDAQKVVNRDVSIKADVEGETIHLLETSKVGDKTSTSEGYIVNGGISKSEQGGKEYEVQEGKLAPAFAFSLGWVTIPLQVGIPLIVASGGSQSAGTEQIDGRPAEKVDMDTARMPTGAMGMLGGLISISQAKGTAWVDKETGALLKMSIDFAQDLYDTTSGDKKNVGKGNGHYDLSVAGVGKTKVVVPPVEDGGATLPSGGPTTEPPAEARATPTSLPAATTAKVGDRTRVGDLTLTVSKAVVTDGNANYPPDDGKTFIAVTVTVENASNARQSVEWSRFEFVDPDGIISGDLQNGFEKSTDFAPNIFKSYDIEPGGKVSNKLILVQVDQGTTSGMSMLFHFDDEHALKVDLGL